MKLKDYIQNLQDLVKKTPEALEYEVIYASDDEGNDHHQVNYAPSLGHYTGGYGGEWYQEEEFGDYEIDDHNSVCIN